MAGLGRPHGQAKAILWHPHDRAVRDGRKAASALYCTGALAAQAEVIERQRGGGECGDLADVVDRRASPGGEDRGF